jgi:hypothetical protein
VIASLENGSKDQACSACHSLGASGGEEQEFAIAAAKVSGSLRDLDPRLTARVRTGLADCEVLYRQYLVHARRKEFQQAHDILTEKMMPAVEVLHRLADALAAEQRAALEKSAAAARAEIATSRWIALILSAFSLLAGVGMLWQARLGCARLRILAARLAQHSVEVAGAARDVSSSSQSLAQGAAEQASTLERTAETGREIQSAAQRNLQSAQATAAVTARVAESTRGANQMVDQMTDAMRDMIRSSDQIGQIIKMIFAV